VNVLLLALLVPVASLIEKFLTLHKGRVRDGIVIPIGEHIRQGLFGYALHHSHRYYKERLAGAVSGKIDKVVTWCNEIITFFIEYFPTAMLSFVAGMVALATVSWKLALVVTLSSLVIGFIGYHFNILWRPAFNKENQDSVNVNASVVDVIQNIAIVRQTGQVANEQKRLNLVLGEYRNSRMDVLGKNRRLNLFSGALWEIVRFILIAMSIFIALDHFSLSDYTLALAVGTSLMNKSIEIVRKIQLIVKRILDVRPVISDLLVPHEIASLPKARNLKVRRGDIVFNNVSFTFDEGKQFMLRNVNLSLDASSIIAVVGEPGSGKTTLANLIMRNYNLQDGIITIDGQDITKVNLDSLRYNVAFISQDPPMFKRTIRENIAYGVKGKLSQEEIVKAAKAAKIHDYIMTLDFDYDTMVGEGDNLSGGQKQRVALARALLRGAKIFVLDEASSILDMIIEKNKVFKGKTVLIVTNRLDCGPKVDKIVSLYKGQIAQEGSHWSLIKKREGAYYRLFKSKKKT
jgi:ATP-binding cassette subfamily B protein